MGSIVSVNNLKKSFGKVEAVSGCSFEINSGEIFGLIGPDGAGKTTTLRMLAGIMHQDSGECTVLGYRLPKEAEGAKEHMGYMPQKFSLYTDLTVQENMEFFADIFSIDRMTLAKRLEPLLKMTRLEPFKDRLAGNLSGGMKQKLALMCTLIHRPKLLILDEPTTGVDPVSRREFWEILQEIRTEGVTLIVSTPYMDEAEWCSRVGLMYAGKFLMSGSPVELKKSIKSSVYEVTGNSEKIKESAKGLASLEDLRPLGAHYRIVISDESDMEIFRQRIGADAQIRKAAVTIEDVFIEKIT
ncbi:MAG: ABC transporter ATP-binding protein [Candidatus Goldiibacteriota bacterium HGW-Goldbacteria-1]|jgi:ABC-2 type transport system ATP-binding protein|nr:MAG: ABC transporter ATP-binding protein [Candidatus Goldiibacteriota bacterium HGW-Goldbacteria-1]